MDIHVDVSEWNKVVEIRHLHALVQNKGLCWIVGDQAIGRDFCSNECPVWRDCQPTDRHCDDDRSEKEINSDVVVAAKFLLDEFTEEEKFEALL